MLDRAEPNLLRQDFPYSRIPAIRFEADAVTLALPPEIWITDTTFRDAHQSLLATRLRTHDMLAIAETYARMCSDLFSIEMWGGATFDVAYRFLSGDPWRRLEELRAKVPNLLFQMLVRGANAVGYTNYPDDVVVGFIEEAAAGGIDVFRIFDALNDVESMRVATEAAQKTGKIVETAICYTGDVSDPARKKFDLAYYVKMAKDIVARGTHILAIKDMAGLLKPRAATMLVTAIREAVDVPIHLHMHDTSGNGITSYVAAVNAGVDIYNFLNSDAITAYNTIYTPGPTNAWGQPMILVSPRFVRLQIQANF